MVNGNLAIALPDNDFQEIDLPESTLKFCTVSLSDVISRGKRLDASVFDVEAKQAYENIKSSKYGYIPLVGSEAFVKACYHAPRFRRNYVDEYHDNAVGFLGSAEMLDCYPFPEKFITMEMAKNLNLFAPEQTVLVSCSGTIGNISFVNKSLRKNALSQHIIRLECDNNSGFLYACLKHPYLQKQLQSLIYGAVIKEIEPHHLEKVIIPDAPAVIKKRIHNLIVDSYELRDESNALIDEATALLVKELQFPDIHEFKVALFKKNARVKTFNVKLSNMMGRADASYHTPIVDAIVKHMKRYAAEVTTVGDSRISKEIILPGRFKRVYVEEGYGRVFIGGKQLYELDPTNKKYLSLVHHGDRIAKQLELHEGMTLITCSGTIGKVTLVGKHWENWTANQHIIRVVPASNDIAGYLSIFLASDYGYPLITRYTYGSVVDEIDDTHVSNIPFPLLKNTDVQRRINELALEANEKRYEAYKKEQQALQIVNKDVIFAK